jgi:large subunit ribosomal protein L28
MHGLRVWPERRRAKSMQYTARTVVPVTQRDRNMAKRCEVCNKGPVFGRTVSHAHNVGPRRFEPNLQTVRAIVNGAAKRIRVCTRCLRDGKVTKAA